MYICPNCKSEDVKKVSLLYESEVKTTNMTTLGGGLAANKEGLAGLGVGLALSSGTIKSLLVQRLIPPDRAKYKHSSPGGLQLGFVSLRQRAASYTQGWFGGTPMPSIK